MNNAELRRLLLDGIKIIEPYRRVLYRSHECDGEVEDEAVKNEIELMQNWVRKARAAALKLKRTTNESERGQS